ncbi:cupredoxin domain-containing protein [uncultured Secundilactobacillus sp.]|uniref:cupredoxin domain-containing protein n=1 Tax=uncultured Secundilactobacillus sp. TaxID=2813935 RepID=UPI00258C00FB|nr:cupredoxin domain-containing protein [uncultured Secundilactobacillus sp.]
MIKLVVFVIGVAAIGFIAWWFFGKHEVATEVADLSEQGQSVDITVQGGYSPEVVELKAGVPATLNFTRTDPSTCLDRVVFSDFGVNQELPINETESVAIDTSKPGEYQWACGMDMFHGKVVVK